MRRVVGWLGVISYVLLAVCYTDTQDAISSTQPEQLATWEALATSANSALNLTVTYHDDLNDILDSMLEVQDDMARDAREIEEGVQVAFSLLGLFEALGFVATAVAALIAVFGFQRLIGAQSEFAEARANLLEEFNKLSADLLTRYDSLVASQIEQFALQRKESDEIQHILKQAENERKEITERAILAQAYLPVGERRYKAQDYSGAISTYQTALQLDPRNPVIHYRLGYVFTQQGDIEHAQQHYETALELAEDFAPALAGLGYVFRRKGEKMESGIERKEALNIAEKYLLRAMELSPKLIDDDGESWWGLLGGLYRRHGQIDDAIYAYKQAIIVTPQSSYGWGNLALLYMKKNDIDNMLQSYISVEKLAEAESAADVHNYWAHTDLVVSRYALGKGEEAAEVLERAIQIAPLESPYMLDGLQGTLEDLLNILPDEKHPPINDAMKHIRDEQDKREKILAERQAET